MPDVYFTSDTHFGHQNILKYCPLSRPWATVEEMDEAIIDNWNRTVKPGDTVYHLGDFALCKGNDPEVYSKRLNGHIFLIRGNHDGNRYRTCKGFDWVGEAYQGRMIKWDRKKFFLSHYAMHVWDGYQYGIPCLYGHSHGSLPERPGVRSFDVGMDCWNCQLVSMEQVMEKLRGIQVVELDHHAKNIQDIL